MSRSVLAPIQIKNFMVTASALRGARWVDSEVHNDDRGYFFEGYRESIHQVLSGDVSEQVNISVSKPMVMRAFHYHNAQIDFWTIASGMAQVVVGHDGFFDSKVLGPGQGVIIQPGIGHGFLALSDLVLIYNVSNEYNRDNPDEHGYSAMLYNEWLMPVEDAIRSQRDIDYDSTHWSMP